MDGEKMKTWLSIFLLGVLFAFVMAGWLALPMLRVLQSKSAGSTRADQVVSASPTPVMVGTEHPVPVSPTPQLTTSPKQKTPNPLTKPAPQVSDVAENDARHEVESPAESVREKAEQARDKAERMRARVEHLYQARRISEEAYKEGQAEYQHELAKYEDQIAKLRGATNETGATNE